MDIFKGSKQNFRAIPEFVIIYITYYFTSKFYYLFVVYPYNRNVPLSCFTFIFWHRRIVLCTISVHNVITKYESISSTSTPLRILSCTRQESWVVLYYYSMKNNSVHQASTNIKVITFLMQVWADKVYRNKIRSKSWSEWYDACQR